MIPQKTTYIVQSHALLKQSFLPILYGYTKEQLKANKRLIVNTFAQHTEC